MSLKNKERNLLNSFLWYSSGLNIRELSSNSQTKSNYFGIGGVNIFSTLLLFLIGTWSFNIAFPIVFFPICLLVGLTLSVFIFIFNRHTINALSVSHSAEKIQRNELTTLPIILFSVFMGVVISTPIKFYLFGIKLNSSLLQRLGDLDKFTDPSISTKISSWSITLIIILVALLPTLIKYYTLSGSYQKKNPSLLSEMMWFCAGANKEILRKCPNDYTKYFGIGGTILFTSLMATLSGGYAFYTAFDSAGLAICFGLFWGSMIFNLDRFIVNTMYSDGKHTISWLELFSGLPRIIIAIFLGIVISYPLELKIFEKEVDARIVLLKLKEEVAKRDSTYKAFGDPKESDNRIISNNNDKATLRREITNAQLELGKYKQIRIVTGSDINGNEIFKYVWPEGYYDAKRNYDEVKKSNNAEIDRINVDNEDLKGKIAQIGTIVKGLSEINSDSIDSKLDLSKNKAIKIKSDLSTRMEAFEQLKEDKEKSSVKTASVFIMILLIIIEIAPVFFKMMLSSGDYERILIAEKNDIEVTELVKMSKKNDWANTEIQKVVEENKKRIAEKQYELATELNSSQELLMLIAEAQSEIAREAIIKWKEDQIERAKNNPESFIQTGTTTNQQSI